MEAPVEEGPPGVPAADLPPPPEAAEAFFGPRLPVAIAYAGLLAGAGVERGLIGPREVPRLWDRHLLNCAAVAALPATGARVADLGSGAGLPGLVVAVLRPDLRVTLIEPLLRRATFLSEAVEFLGLETVDVLRSRAEDVPAGAGFDVVFARAVAPLDKLAGWAMPLLRPGGSLLALKGATAAAELRTAEARLRALGATVWTVRACSVPGSEPTTLIDVTAGVPRETRRPRTARAARGRR